MHMTKRLGITLAVIGALLLVAVITVGIIVIVSINNNAAAVQEADYRACVDSARFGMDQVEEMIDRAGVCYSSIYGK